MDIIPVLVAVASALAGHQVDVTCAPITGGEGGWYHSGVITLAPEVCSRLAGARAGKITIRNADAVLTLAHEAMHASGLPFSYDETMTECRALLIARRTALLLGVSRQETQYMWPQIMESHRYVRTFDGYHDFACPRGSWILRP